ncbi:MAG: DUF2797 domain-containing protein, partial [Natronomonas sp.]
MQAVGYDTGAAGDAEPALLVARDGVVEREPLPKGNRLSFSLGERRCAGAINGTSHVSCEAPSAPYCDVHDSTW